MLRDGGQCQVGRRLPLQLGGVGPVIVWLAVAGIAAVLQVHSP